MKRAAEYKCATPAPRSKKIRVRQSPSAEAKDIDYPKKQASLKMKNVKAIHKVAEMPKSLCHGELFDLASRHLIKPLPMKHERQAQKSLLNDEAIPPSPSPEIEPWFWYPRPVRDNIKKTLFLHPSNREIVWVGQLAKAKLKKEVKNYHRIKDLWLFQASDSLMPGYDKKHEFIAKVYEDEMLSPWVACWLSELIGAAEVDKILEYVESNLRKSLAELK
ncbi:hypothetical protein Daus18300_007683 [Diaporthe australafricana]|uniref:Uncharacterized protein n=1 Tax=Diaporthe australafricana TaxID=127596 RepID=A0ABR3WLD5_9PEZI